MLSVRVLVSFALGIALVAGSGNVAVDNFAANHWRAHARAQDNPFAGKTLYVNPSYAAELETSINSCSPPSCSASTKATLERMRNVPSAYWLDTISKISCSNTSCASGILADAQKKGNQLVTLIVYDLPNRDCNSKASNGEICCTSNPDGTCNYDAGGDCSDGITKYKSMYIDALASVLRRFPSVPVVLIIEPDSLPNLATNQGNPHCGNSATTAAYTSGVPYAINTLAQASPNITMYLDAAHGGWLGWDNNLQKYMQILQQLNVLRLVRGLATNTANYQPLGTACPQADWCLPNAGHESDACCADPCRLEGQYNPANNELNYVEELLSQLSKIGYTDKQFVIDTGRNGQPNARADCANWCNIRRAVIGEFPTLTTASPSIDAYLWLKTPGESDGCTAQLPSGGACSRFDPFCGSQDSIGSQAEEPRAPVAGLWFDYMVKKLASGGASEPRVHKKN